MSTGINFALIAKQNVRHYSRLEDNLNLFINLIAPEWTSVNLGIVICVKCSGVHRQIGTHVSQVKSLHLDVDCWKGELLKVSLF